MKRRYAITSAALLAVPIALSGPGAAAPKPPKKPKVPKTPLSLVAKPAPVAYGDATVLSGRLSGANNTGRTITLQEDTFPFGGGFKSLATVVTGRRGSFSFTRKPSKNTAFVATLGATRSPSVKVNVRIRMSLRVSDSTPRVGQRVRFRGRACPTHNGVTVAIQRQLRNGRFRTVRKTTLKRSTRCSAYSTAFRVRRSAHYRATADDAAHARGYSGTRVLTAHN